MALFTGTFENKIDRKGRVSLPADFRTELPDGGDRVVYVYRSPKWAALEACDKSFMQRLADSLDQLNMFSDEEDDLGATLVADARRIILDGEGRFILPSLFIDFAGLDDRAVFVGRGSRFQIWASAAFGDYSNAARERARGRTINLSRPDTGNLDGGK
jgi:MraZ protein